MLIAIFHLLALRLAQIRLPALDFLFVQPATARLHDRVSATSAAVLVATLIANMQAALQDFPASVPACRRVFRARQLIFRLPTGASPLLGENAR